MKLYLFTFLLALPLLPFVITTTHRRILHQPFFPATPTPPSPPSPPTPDNPFFHETPIQPTPDHPQSPPPEDVAVAGSMAPSPANNSGKKLTVGLSVVIVSLGMLSGFAFFIYKHKAKQQIESRKLVRDNNNNNNNGELAENLAAARFLYIGTVETSTTATESISGMSNGSPYNKLKTSDRYRPSPDLQPLPPLSKPPAAAVVAVAATASSDEEEIHDFYTPHGSIASTDDGNSVRSLNIKRIHRMTSNPNSNSKRTSPRSRLSVCSSPDSISDSPAKQPPARLHINQSQQKPKIPIPPPPPSLTPLEKLKQIIIIRSFRSPRIAAGLLNRKSNKSKTLYQLNSYRLEKL